MSATENLSTPTEIDTKLAELYNECAKIDSHISAVASTLKSAAGAEYHYQGRRRVTDMTLAQAVALITERLANPTDEYQLGLSRGFYTISSARNDLAKLETLQAQLAATQAQMTTLNDLYTGWSRFFVVTSSNGHIHSSRNCSTCRPTTTYGWLPNLSGKDQADAIEHFGSAAECLCSVCFPDAPVARKDGNLTAKQRDALLAGKTPETIAAKPVCEGSGQYAEVARQGYAAGNWAECPVCNAHVGGGRKVRKHAPQGS